MATKRELEKIVAALEDPRFKWRTIAGVVKDAQLSESVVLEGLEELRKSGFVIRSSIPSENGEDLFTTRKHYKSFTPMTERLSAIFRNRAS